MSQSGMMAALMGLLLAVASAGGQDAHAGRAKPNIVFIMIDTLRSDHVGCYGYKRKTTPNIDRFAEEGVRFAQMVSASGWTKPSLMTMFTSLPPTLHGATKARNKLRDGVTTLAAELRKTGYQTMGFCSNPTANGKFGFSRGFDVYDDFTIPLACDLNLFQDFDDEQRIQAIETAPHVNRLAFRWLEKKRKEGKFFLFLLYLDPHADYSPPAPYDTMFDPDYEGFADGTSAYPGRTKGKLTDRDKEHVVALYDGEIRYTDEHVGRLLQKLDDLRLVEDTVVLIIGDHGEEFWDHGRTLHGHSLYEELTRVPWLLRYPRRLTAGTVVKEQVCHADVMPTLLELAGLPVPAQCRGQSLVKRLTENRHLDWQCAFLETETREKIQAVRVPGRKLLLRPDSGVKELYDLTADPHERVNLIDSAPDWAAGLMSRFDRWRTHVRTSEKAMADGGRPELDKKTLRHLKGLGYIP